MGNLILKLAPFFLELIIDWFCFIFISHKRYLPT